MSNLYKRLKIDSTDRYSIIFITVLMISLIGWEFIWQINHKNRMSLTASDFVPSLKTELKKSKAYTISNNCRHVTEQILYLAIITRT